MELTSGGYDPAHFATLAAVEDRHFWFRARNAVVRTLAAQASRGMPAGFRALEIGCGDGNVLRHLQASCPGAMVVGMDLHQDGLALARRRCCCPLVRGDAARPPFRSTFHLVGAFDVLEHIPDDRRALEDWRALLDGAGRLLLTVPAHPSLWSYFDEASQHCRRYEAGGLRSLLEAAGFAVEYLTEYMSAAYPLVRLRKLLRARESPSATLKRDLRVAPLVNQAFAALLRIERAAIARRRRLPFGSSIVAVAKPRS